MSRLGDVSEAGRSATAPLAKVSSAHEDAALEPKLDAGGFTPFGAPFAQSPQPSATLYAPILRKPLFLWQREQLLTALPESLLHLCDDSQLCVLISLHLALKRPQSISSPLV